jgi:hypothetical protein
MASLGRCPLALYVSLNGTRLAVRYTTGRWVGSQTGALVALCQAARLAGIIDGPEKPDARTDGHAKNR